MLNGRTSMSIFNRAYVLAVIVLLCPVFANQSLSQGATNATYEELVEGRLAIGNGALRAFSNETSTLISVPNGALDRTLLWYVEAARFPSFVASVGGTEISSRVIQLEKVGNRLFVRDLSSSLTKRVAGGGGLNVPFGSPIESAVSNVSLSQVLLAARLPDICLGMAGFLSSGWLCPPGACSKHARALRI